MTKLERGIKVFISPDELEYLKENHKGFLSRSAYPESYEKIAYLNEVGRFMIFRLVVMRATNEIEVAERIEVDLLGGGNNAPQKQEA
jgi:hypothetical protein